MRENKYRVDERDLEEIAVIKMRGYHSLLDYMTTEEEVMLLVKRIHSFLKNKYPQGFIPWLDNHNQEYLKDYIHLKAITEKFGNNLYFYACVDSFIIL